MHTDKVSSRKMAKKQAKISADNALYTPPKIKLSETVSQILSKLGITHFIDGNTLLGAHFNGKVILNDDSFEFVIYDDHLLDESSAESKIEYLTSLMNKIREKLEGMGGGAGGISSKNCSSLKQVRLISTYAFKLEVFDSSHGSYEWKSPNGVTNQYNVCCGITLLLKSEDKTLRLQNKLNKDIKIHPDDVFPIVERGIHYEGNKYNCVANPSNYLICRCGTATPECSTSEN